MTAYIRAELTPESELHTPIGSCKLEIHYSKYLFPTVELDSKIDPGNIYSARL
jgi:hypothetical protein